MQPAGCIEALIEGAEDHREEGTKGSMESADRIGKCSGVLLDGSGNPRMGKLQQERPARAQENCGLAVDLPSDRPRTEDARERIGRGIAYGVQLAFQPFRADDFELIMLCRCAHDLGGLKLRPTWVLSRPCPAGSCPHPFPQS
jgi:hypothetical protein